TACFSLEEYDTAKTAFEAGCKLAPDDARFTDWIKKCEKCIAEEDGELPTESLDVAPTNVVASSQATEKTDATSEVIAPTPAKPKYRHEFYQKPEEVVVTIFAKGIPANSVFVNYGEQILSVTIDVPGEDSYIYQPRLFGKIVPAKCRHVVLSTKVEIRLAKAELIQWTSLKYGENSLVAQRINVSTGNQRPTYPSSRPTKDWDKLEAQVKKEEKDEKLDGDAALNKFFRDIYKDADEDTRRAMRKSFVESNGTVLSTNWKEVGSKMVEGTPPDAWLCFEAVHSHFVQVEVLVIKPHNKTPYELIRGRPPLIDFMKPFGCPVTILNTKDHLGKFSGKADEGYFVGYSVVRNGPDWLFDVDSLSISMNYVPVAVGNKTNGIAGTKDNIVAGLKDCEGDAGMKPTEVDENEASDKSRKHDQEARNNMLDLLLVLLMNLKNNFLKDFLLSKMHLPFHLFQIYLQWIIQAFFGKDYDAEGCRKKRLIMNNVISFLYTVPDTSLTKFHKDHPEDQVIGSLKTPVQTRHMTKINEEHGLISSVEAMQDEILQFKLLKVWTLVDLPRDKWAIGTKWVFRNKKDERGIVVKNKARLVAQGYTQEEVIPDGCEECFSIWKDRRGGLIRRVWDIYQPVGKNMWLRFWKKYDFGLRKDSKHSMETYKAFGTTTLMFAVCAYARFQVTLKTSHLHAVKRIFRYLKGQPKLGLWYPRDSPFDLEAFSDSDYAGASLDRKSTTGGCQFLRRRLISWQCKKQTIVANSTTEAEYVAAANCRGQVLWIQNQMLDYGFNFMNTKIYIDNESTICIVKNPVFHYKTKHIEIRHHFIRDSYKKLIQVIKIHTYHNVADLLTKAFDISSSYVSLIEQFWQTATASTLEDGDMGITTTIDGKVKVVFEASIRRHLKLEDSDGISTLSTTVIFKQLALMGGWKIAPDCTEDVGITLVQMGAQTTGEQEWMKIYITDMDVTLAEALMDLLKSGKKKSPNPKARGISFQDPEEVARREVISPPVSKISAKDKGKAIMTEPKKPSKKKDQIQIDEELALRLHAEEQAEFEILQKERDAQEEASKAAIYEQIDNIQAMIEADE
ncbi:putative ribonuclease H-like domain-containing protein, partial [Tanacetum coccineum]